MSINGKALMFSLLILLIVVILGFLFYIEPLYLEKNTKINSSSQIVEYKLNIVDKRAFREVFDSVLKTKPRKINIILTNENKGTFKYFDKDNMLLASSWVEENYGNYTIYTYLSQRLLDNPQHINQIAFIIMGRSIYALPTSIKRDLPEQEIYNELTNFLKQSDSENIVQIGK
ncbi:MAG: hypothetical protein AAB546_04910 [Patescibacteria group bacterium]